MDSEVNYYDEFKLVYLQRWPTGVYLRVGAKDEGEEEMKT